MVLSEQDRSDLGFNTTTTSRIRFSSDSSPDSRGTFREYEWTDYCPEVFRKLQEFEKINAGDYLQSVHGRETIKLLFLQKKNSSRLFSSYDDKFIFKTLSKPEMKVILEMLPNYYQHVQKYRNTLLTKFCGLHVVKPSNGQKVRFIVMENILQSDVSIHKTFSLRGSSQNRSISKTGAEEDIHFAFHLHTPTRNQILAPTQIHNRGYDNLDILSFPPEKMSQNNSVHRFKLMFWQSVLLLAFPQFHQVVVCLVDRSEGEKLPNLMPWSI